MSSWFYIRQWGMKKLSYIGKELSYNDANSLFKAVISHNSGSKEFYALIKKDNKWKVVSSKNDIMDWTIVSSSVKNK